ncbi:two-component hybrid sensor and regulator [[Synechococcus] sp. NIES-970]|nr:two-component hybrid sensor and regulator [[Synechococcus] sp. NIES-970]
MFYLSKFPPKLAQRWIRILLLALVYYGTAEISRLVAATPQSVTPVWPPDGFALAATLIYGYPILPGVFLGSFLANIWAFFQSGSFPQAVISVLQVLAIALGTTAGIGCGRYLLVRNIQHKNPLKKFDDLCRLLLLAGTVAPAINASSGILALAIGGSIPWSAVGQEWLTWWISNISGIYIFTPVLISWYELFQDKPYATFKHWFGLDHQKHSRRSPQKIWVYFLHTKFIEALCLLTIIGLISYLSFYQEFHLEYMLMPYLIWIVIRFGQLGVTNAIVVITTLAVFGTVRELGTFASENINQSLLHLQLFIVVVVGTSLSLTATITEKKEAFDNLQKSKIYLQEKTDQLEASKVNLKKTAVLLEQQNLELFEAKQTADNANRSKTKFLSSMSHELRTPLNAILGLVELLKDSENLDEFEKEDLQIVGDSGRHLLSLIEDILDISRIEAGKIELQPQRVDLPQFLQKIRGIIQSQIKQEKVQLICDFSESLPTVIYADEKRLKQVLLNLLQNAVKFTEKGQIIFQVKQSLSPGIADSHILLSFVVEDSGIGIDADKKHLIFLPFEQTGKSKFKAQGTGLGLAISQEIVRMMGGNIVVDSQLGVGSKFQFMIYVDPVTDGEHVPPDSPQPLFVLDKNLAQKLPLKILLAEDNLTNQKVILKILNSLGYEVTVVANGLAVLAAVERETYDVILMDMQMPEMDGLEATRQLVNLNLDPRPYIIALTANAMHHDRLACLNAGMDDYITKPIYIGHLVQALWRSQSHRVLA